MNSKETDYLKVVRTDPSPVIKEKVDIKESHTKMSFKEKLEWRGLEPSTIVISGIAYLTVAVTMCALVVQEQADSVASCVTILAK